MTAYEKYKADCCKERAMNKDGFIISIGDYKPTYAKNADEVAEAVKHYFGVNHGLHDRTICPFCKKEE